MNEAALTSQIMQTQQTTQRATVAMAMMMGTNMTEQTSSKNAPAHLQTATASLILPQQQRVINKNSPAPAQHAYP
ncbi:MAG: hypothetical protein QM758_23060 [Armatimonas sp.]